MTDPEPAPSVVFKDRLLDAMLARAGAAAWTQTALEAAARDAGLSQGEALLGAPRGIIDLIDAFAARADAAARRRLQASPLGAMKIRERVTAGVRFRIEALTPDKDAVRRAAIVLAAPQHAAAAAQIGWRTADMIWRTLGDKSTDENYYSKRAILAGVHGATLVRWLADADPAAAATWAFLDARIEGVMRFEKLKSQLKPLSAAGPSIVGMLARLRYGR